MSGEGFRVRNLESIHVVFVGKGLVIIQSYVWSALSGFTKDAVAFQESWRVMLISIAGDVWTSFSQFCWKRLWLSPMWSWNVFFCYLGDTLGAGGGVEEAARARVRCAWAKFKNLLLTARGASYHIKGKIYKACVQSVHMELKPGRWR